MLQHGQITDAEVYSEQSSLWGICDSFDVPEIENGTYEHNTLGSIGVLKMAKRGAIQALEGVMTLNHPEPDLMRLTSNPRQMAKFQLHQRLDIFGQDGLDETTSTTLITHVSVMFPKRASPAASKEDGKYTADFIAYRFMQRLTSEETPIVEYDFFTRTYNVDGKPVWPR